MVQSIQSNNRRSLASKTNRSISKSNMSLESSDRSIEKSIKKNNNETNESWNTDDIAEERSYNSKRTRCMFVMLMVTNMMLDFS